MTETEQINIQKLNLIASSFERVEKSLDGINKSNTEILDRLTRMEVQQSGHGAEIHHQREQVKDLAGRLAHLELNLAVQAKHAEAAEQRHEGDNERLLKRWGAIGAIALVILGAMGNALSSVVFSYYQDRRDKYEEDVKYDRHVDRDRRDAEFERLRGDSDERE